MPVKAAPPKTMGAQAVKKGREDARQMSATRTGFMDILSQNIKI
jgi:hypothetical protein